MVSVPLTLFILSSFRSDVYPFSPEHLVSFSVLINHCLKHSQIFVSDIFTIHTDLMMLSFKLKSLNCLILPAWWHSTNEKASICLFSVFFSCFFSFTTLAGSMHILYFIDTELPVIPGTRHPFNPFVPFTLSPYTYGSLLSFDLLYVLQNLPEILLILIVPHSPLYIYSNCWFMYLSSCKRFKPESIPYRLSGAKI